MGSSSWLALHVDRGVSVSPSWLGRLSSLFGWAVSPSFLVALLSPCWLGDLSSLLFLCPLLPCWDLSLWLFRPSPLSCWWWWWWGHPSCPLPFRLGGLHLPFLRRSLLPSCLVSPPSLFVEGCPSPPSWLGRLPSLVFWWSNFLLLVGRSLFVFLVGPPFSLFVGKKRRKKRKKEKKTEKTTTENKQRKK